MMKIILEKLQKEGLTGLFRYIMHWIYEKYHEKRLGIRTAGFMHTDDLNITDKDCNHYEPCSYASIFNVLKKLKIDPQRDVFIDYGSGKGRAVIVAATFPFKRVIGVEIAPQLTAAAEENFKIAQSRNVLKCLQGEFITADAFDYQPPDDVTVIFLNNPFSEKLMQDTVDKVLQSVERVPREVYFILRYPNWSKDFFKDDNRFTLIYHFAGYSDAGEISKVYKKN